MCVCVCARVCVCVCLCGCVSVYVCAFVAAPPGSPSCPHVGAQVCDAIIQINTNAADQNLPGIQRMQVVHSESAERFLHMYMYFTLSILFRPFGAASSKAIKGNLRHAWLKSKTCKLSDDSLPWSACVQPCKGRYRRTSDVSSLSKARMFSGALLCLYDGMSLAPTITEPACMIVLQMRFRFRSVYTYPWLMQGS